MLWHASGRGGEVGGVICPDLEVDILNRCLLVDWVQRKTSKEQTLNCFTHPTNPIEDLLHSLFCHFIMNTGTTNAQTDFVFDDLAALVSDTTIT